MFGQSVSAIAILVGAFALLPPPGSAQQTTESEREAMYHRYLDFASYVKGGSVEPHWMADGNSFWYAEGRPANTVIWKVDPRAGTKTPLFDTARLRQALTPLLGHEPPHQGLPFTEFTFADKAEKEVKFTVENQEFILQLDTYTVTRAPALSEEEKSRTVPQIVLKSFPRVWPDLFEVLSPDQRWFATLKDYNLWLRSTYDGRMVQLTSDGIKDYEWAGEVAQLTTGVRRWAWWSPNSLKLALRKRDFRKVPSIPVVHWLSATAEVEWMRKPRAGGPIPQTELFIVDILSERRVRVDTGEEPDQYIPVIGWRSDGSELLFLRLNRDYKKMELMAANPETGATRVVLTETQRTFIGGRLVNPGEWHLLFAPVGDENRFIWMSERDGWNHLYLYDLEGRLIRRLTEGAFPVVRVVAVDEKAGWVYFIAHGDQQRPYDTHLYRVNLEGKGLARLTEATGQHNYQFPGIIILQNQFSPSKQFFLDTHSSVDRPPAVELRSADGRLLQTLSKANIELLKALRWSPPEEFVVKAADGKTDLYGVLYKPYDFDPNKKYPVIDRIYGAPWFAVVSRTFIPTGHAFSAQALAQLGFVVFMVDARGTPERSKEFHDADYGNWGRSVIPDHVATLKQLAEQRPYMDLSRVGIYGFSAGGTNTVRAMLVAPEIYHVGIAAAPSPGPWRNSGHILLESYMGLPQNNKEGYDYASLPRLAGNLKGKLLLIAMTSDVDAPFSGIMNMVEAFIRAGKPYDLIILPEQNHSPSGASRTYWRDAVGRYFQEHLKP